MKRGQVLGAGVFAMCTWQSALADLIALSMPVGYYAGEGIQINDSGYAVGTLQIEPGSGHNVPVLWHLPENQITILPTPSEFPYGFARALSADGRIIIGQVYSQTGGRPVVWRDGEVQVLSVPPGVVNGIPVCVDHDGGVVCGYGGLAPSGVVPLVWRNGTVETLPALPGGESGAWIAGVSADGRIMAGVSDGPPPRRGGAVMWLDGAVADLESPLYVTGLSATGQTVIGWIHDGGVNRGYKWNAGELMELGFAGGQPESQPIACSADGSRIVGQGQGGAFLWDERRGSRFLKAALRDEYGVDVGGWCLQNANGISDSGRYVVGTGWRPDGRFGPWAVQLGDSQPAPCAPDFNRDGFLDFFDYDAFVLGFEEGNPRTDFNGDCFVDFFDYDEFVGSFERGC